VHACPLHAHGLLCTHPTLIYSYLAIYVRISFASADFDQSLSRVGVRLRAARGTTTVYIFSPSAIWTEQGLLYTGQQPATEAASITAAHAAEEPTGMHVFAV